jgi:hypothetical protein
MIDMNTVKQILSSGNLSKEFYQDSNVWNVIAQVAFHFPMDSIITRAKLKGILLEFKSKEEDFKKVGNIRRTQLGGYNWEFCNMDVSQEDKIAACAYMFSQCFNVLGVGRYHEGFYVPPPKPTKEDWLKQIMESVEKDRIEEQARQEKIASGEITLPQKDRPYEAWVKQESGKYTLWKTARSREALAKSIDFAGLIDYKEYYCPGPDERSRQRL